MTLRYTVNFSKVQNFGKGIKKEQSVSKGILPGLFTAKAPQHPRCCGILSELVTTKLRSICAAAESHLDFSPRRLRSICASTESYLDFSPRRLRSICAAAESYLDFSPRRLRSICAAAETVFKLKIKSQLSAFAWVLRIEVAHRYSK